MACCRWSGSTRINVLRRSGCANGQCANLLMGQCANVFLPPDFGRKAGLLLILLSMLNCSACVNKSELPRNVDSTRTADSLAKLDWDTPLECEPVRCDTINTYNIIFQNCPSTKNVPPLMGGDTISLHCLDGTFFIEGWQCSPCRGNESVFLSDVSGVIIDTLRIHHEGHLLRSRNFQLMHLAPNHIYHATWKNGPDFFIAVSKKP